MSRLNAWINAIRNGVGSRSLALFDQVFFSSVALLQVAVYARTFEKSEFGVFSLALGLGLIATGIQRSALVLPMIVTVPSPEATSGAQSFERVQVICAVAALGSLAAAALVIGQGPASQAAGAAAFFVGPGLYYEFQRRWLFQKGKRKAAVIAAATYAGSNAVGVAVVALVLPTIQAAAIALAGAALLAGIVARLMRGPLEDGEAPPEVRREAMSIASWNLLSFAPYALYNNGMPLIIGLIAGPATVAAFAAARIFLAPIQMLISAVDSVDKPRASRAYAKGGEAALSASLSNTRTTLLLAGGAYLILVGAATEPLLRLALGAGYGDQALTARLWLAVAAFMLLGQPLETGLITVRRSEFLTLTRCVAAAVAVTSALLLTPRFGAAGAVSSLVVAWATGAFLAWIALKGRLNNAEAGNAASEGDAVKQLYIAWIGFQRRPDAMRDRFGYELVHLPPPFSKRILKPFGYVLQFLQTWKLLDRRRPDVVWLQLPPTFLLPLVFLHRTLSGRRYKVVADCHNAALRAPWNRLPGYVAALNRADAALAHNAEVLEDAATMGVRRDRLVLLETRPADLARPRTNSNLARRPMVLAPCSFGIDEPVEALIAAAALAPEIDFHVTGPRERAEALGLVANAPKNVTFTGYLSKAAYDGLLTECDVVLGLTTKEGIQLSVANEATGAERPMVLSDTRILRELFWTGALFTANEDSSIAGACREAVARIPELTAQVKVLKRARESRWQDQASVLISKLRAGDILDRAELAA